MSEALLDVGKGYASAKGVERFSWGLLLIWIGAVLLLRWGWGVGLVGAGAVVLAAHGWRRHLGLPLDVWGVVLGVTVLLCGIWTLLAVSIDLVPVLCIAAGVALLASTRRAGHAPSGGAADVHGASHHHA